VLSLRVSTSGFQICKFVKFSFCIFPSFTFQSSIYGPRILVGVMKSPVNTLFLFVTNLTAQESDIHNRLQHITFYSKGRVNSIPSMHPQQPCGYPSSHVLVINIAARTHQYSRTCYQLSTAFSEPTLGLGFSYTCIITVINTCSSIMKVTNKMQLYRLIYYS
jgi:hypothetical protein